MLHLRYIVGNFRTQIRQYVFQGNDTDEQFFDRHQDTGEIELPVYPIVHFDAARNEGFVAIESNSIRKDLEVRSQRIESTLQLIGPWLHLAGILRQSSSAYPVPGSGAGVAVP
jgi:hypothetical protein